MGVQFSVVAFWISARNGNNADDVWIMSGLIYPHIFGNSDRKENKLHGECFGKPCSKKSITDDGVWLDNSKALVLNPPWLAHADVFLFQFI